MTQISADVVVHDKISPTIEKKLVAIGDVADKVANKLAIMQGAISSLNPTGINAMVQAMRNLASVNPFGKLSSSVQQLTLQQFKQQQLTLKLQIEQAKLARETQKVATEAGRTAQAQARANAIHQQAQLVIGRQATELARLHRTQIQAQSASVLLAQREERLRQTYERGRTGINGYNNSLREVARTIASVATIQWGLSKAISTADAYQGLINKLTMVTGSADEAKNRLGSLADVAKSSYSSVESVTQLYQRLHLAFKQAGGTASEALNATEALSKAVSLAGLTSGEASSALLQVSQAFNKGKLDGDEFRTVMEVLPTYADHLAKALNTTRGELLKLAPKGQITMDVMRKAMLSMTEDVDDKFSRLTPTISQQLENLATEAKLYFGSVFNQSGMAQSMGNAVKWIAENMDQLVRIATTAGSVLATVFVVGKVLSYANAMLGVVNVWKTATATVTGLRAVIVGTNAVMASTPIGLLIAGVAGLSYLFTQLYESTGDPLLPYVDQDIAKAKDLAGRIDDVNRQMLSMSTTSLWKTYEKGVQASEELNRSLEINAQKLANVREKIRLHNEAVAQRDTRLASGNDLLMAQYDWYGVTADIIDQNILSTKELNEAKEAEKQLTEETTQNAEDYYKILESNLLALTEYEQRVKDSEKALQGYTAEQIANSTELQIHQGIVNRTKEQYANLQIAIANTEAQLKSLISLDPSTGFASQISAVALKASQIATGKELTVREQIHAKLDKEAKEKKDLEDLAEINKFNKEKADFERKQQLKNLKGKDHNAYASMMAERKLNEADKQRTLTDGSNLYDQKKKFWEDYYRKESELSAPKGKSGGKPKKTEAQQKAEKQKKQLEKANEDYTSYLQKLEENSLANKQKQAEYDILAINKANITKAEKGQATNEVLGGMGIETDGNQRWIDMKLAQEQAYYEQLQLMRDQELISVDEHERYKADIAKRTQEEILNAQWQAFTAQSEMHSVLGTAIDTLGQNATSSIMSILNGTMSVSQAMRQLGQTILQSVVKAIIDMGVQYAMQALKAQIMGQTITTQATAQATTIASAYATPASLVSLASYGANAPPAMAGMTATMALGKTLAVAGARRNGGTVNAGDLYRVGEGNAPEIFQSRSGNQYMISGDNGKVIPNSNISGGSSVNVTQYITFSGGENGMDKENAKAIVNLIKTTVYDVLGDESRNGGILA